MSIEEKKKQIESILSELTYKESSIIVHRLLEERYYRYSFLKLSDELHFPKVQEVQEVEALFNFLVEGRYISDGTKKRDFMYYLGHYYSMPERLNAIQWMETKQLLRELLESLYSDVMSKADIERIAVFAFVDKKGHYMRLAKNKIILSTKSDELKEFLAKNNQTNNQSR